MSGENDPRTPEQILADEAVQRAIEEGTFSQLTSDESKASLARARAKKLVAHPEAALKHERAQAAISFVPRLRVYSFGSVEETLLVVEA